jgi:ABC-type antimicrobial peptide transport system permease subunit
MITDKFAILMVISLGAMAGTAIGLFIGFALRKQKSEWSAMTSSEKSINISLIVVCSVACIAGLAWYSLQTPLV